MMKNILLALGLSVSALLNCGFVHVAHPCHPMHRAVFHTARPRPSRVAVTIRHQAHRPPKPVHGPLRWKVPTRHPYAAYPVYRSPNPFFPHLWLYPVILYHPHHTVVPSVPTVQTNVTVFAESPREEAK